MICLAVLELGATHVSTKTYGTVGLNATSTSLLPLIASAQAGSWRLQVAYMPAEVLTKGKLSLASDVYSFSMISE